MKKLFFVLIALVAFKMQAQEENKEGREHEKRAFMEDLTPEEMASLKTKKMTLDLDLTEAQQREIKQLNFEDAKQRKAKMEERKNRRNEGEKAKPSKEERLKRMNEHLDREIAQKKKMKSILNKEQFEKWERNKRQHKKGLKNRKMKKKGVGEKKRRMKKRNEN